MPLLTVNNLTSSPLVLQEPSGNYAGLVVRVPANGSVSGLYVLLAELAALEPLLIKEAAAGNITWSAMVDTGHETDQIPEHVATATATPYNAVANDQVILTNRATSGTMSVVLSAAAPIGQEVQVTDLKGDAGSNNVTITVASAGTINGGASLVINTNNGTAYLVKTGTNAWVGTATTSISSAAAGGDLTGNYPNPTLTTLLVSAAATISGSGTLSVTHPTTLFTSTGAGNALSLPDGTRAGQRVTVIHTVKGTSGTGVITPVHAGNFATCTLTNKWDWATFEWSGSAWNVVAAAGAFAGLA